ncbi:DUF1194 domain-containing protein [Rhodosalinus sp.]|uniref:DUF1194 domain-containing protein n=1 Tax=Rhodosalinus sp. TaxID=2047741 RepID=UPI00397D8B0A
MVRALALLFGLWAGGAGAAECRLALLLALDVSSSVDAQEHRLQRDGLAAALMAPDIRAAILSGAPGQVAFGVYEWSGRSQQQVILPWTMLDSDATIESVAATIRAAPRSYSRFPTAVGYALGYASTLFAEGPACDQRVLDVSGDGIGNDGFEPMHAYRHFPFAGITVNGLAVGGHDPQVLDYYMFDLRHGPGAFVEFAEDYDDFRRAMERKLYRELGGMAIGRAEE